MNFSLLEIYRVMKALVTHFAHVTHTMITNTFVFDPAWRVFEKTVFPSYILENEWDFFRNLQI
jgi:hypothetical protein